VLSRYFANCRMTEAREHWLAGFSCGCFAHQPVTDSFGSPVYHLNTAGQASPRGSQGREKDRVLDSGRCFEPFV